MIEQRPLLYPSLRDVFETFGGGLFGSLACPIITDVEFGIDISCRRGGARQRCQRRCYMVRRRNLAWIVSLAIGI